jgi:radical SAM-linked protein
MVYRIDGDMRYLSHQEEMRLLMRACARARWPIAYSQGFNPQPLMGIPLPRSVGTAGGRQWALIRLDQARTARELFESLQPVLAGHVTLHCVIAPLPHRRLHARRVEYRIPLESNDAALVAPRLDQLLASESVSIMRTYGPGKPSREIDIRPFIGSITLDRDALRLSLVVDQQRTARPNEIMDTIGLSTERYGHRTIRTEIDWVENVFASPHWPVPPERTHCGHEDRSQDRQTSGHQA